MSILSWDGSTDRRYETGVKKGVLYPYSTDIEAFSESKAYKIGDVVSYNGSVYVCKTAITSPSSWSDSNWTVTTAYRPGVAWNGLSSVSESPSGAEETAIYADDIKYLSLRSAEELGLTVEAYTYPDEWAACDGSATVATGATIGQQRRKKFGLCYRTIIGDEASGDDLGYKLHLVYGCTASPSERAYASVNDSPEAITFSWEITTVPVEVANYKPTSCITIDSTKFTTAAQKACLANLENALYGTAATDPYLPSPAEIITILTPAEG